MATKLKPGQVLEREITITEGVGLSTTRTLIVSLQHAGVIVREKGKRTAHSPVSLGAIEWQGYKQDAASETGAAVSAARVRRGRVSRGLLGR